MKAYRFKYVLNLLKFGPTFLPQMFIYSQSNDSDKLGCSKYNCKHRGSLLIDLIGVISGGCCHCFVSVGIHNSASLLVPVSGRDRK